MKTLGIILLMLGTGLTAAFAARNVDPIVERQRVTGAAAVLGQDLRRVDAALADEALPTAERHALEAEREGLVAAVAEARERVADLPEEAVPAGDRLRDWFELSGLPFVGGLLLIITGAVLARRGIRAEAARAGTDATGSRRGPVVVDLGEKLDQTRERVAALLAQMDATEPSVEALEPIADAIAAIQLEDIEPMVESRDQVIARYKMAGFAQLFGPLSGAERWLNRAWVALVDRHWEEANASLTTAIDRLDETRAALAELKSERAP